MCGCIDRASQNPALAAVARDAVARFGALGASFPAMGSGFAPGGDAAGGIAADRAVGWRSSADLARAVFWWVKYAVSPMRHSQFKTLVAAFPEKKQLIVDPVALLGMDRPAGDCSAFTMLVCALLRRLWVRYELVTVAVDPEEPSIFTHVYPRAVLDVLRPGSSRQLEAAGADARVRLPLDAHAGTAPGWEVPAQDVFRKQVWDAHGQPIADGDSRRFTGLHEYIGLGDDAADVASIDVTYDPTSGLYADTGTGLPASTIDALTLANQITPSYSLPAGSMVAPSPTSTNWAAFATALAKSGMTLAEINAIQPGTVVGANGQILRQATGLPVPVAGGSVTAALGSNSSLLLFGGLAVVVVLMLAMSKKS